MPSSDSALSTKAWLHVRARLTENRYQLAVEAASEFPIGATVLGTPLLAQPTWIPHRPIPLGSIGLRLDRDAHFNGVTGREEALQRILPIQDNGSPFESYAEAIRDLARPAVFDDRPTYRLVEADLAGPEPHLRFGHGSYFEGINTGEAAAHEYAARRLGIDIGDGIRSAVGDPRDLARRPANLAISTLTVRRDASAGASYLVHWRDPGKVGHAGGLYQVVPVGIFQPSGPEPWHELNDFSLWRNVVREMFEELLGGDEDYNSDRGPIDYDAWPFSVELTAALDDGSVRAYCVGLGVDPLTFATDLLTVVVFDGRAFDRLFGQVVRANSEGRVLDAQPFTPEAVEGFVAQHPMQAAGAALLRLAANADLG
jgi:hypothetical protein